MDAEAKGTLKVEFTVFAKPWDLPLPKLARFIKDLGFDGVELPIRPGFQVEPENVIKDLPKAVKIFADNGLKIGSISGPQGPVDETMIVACGQAGVPIIRICAEVYKDKGYFQVIEDHQRDWDKLVPILDKHGVAIGLQNHSVRHVASAMQVYHAMGKYDPKHICFVWDVGHHIKQGEDIDTSLEIMGRHLAMVNLKNTYFTRVSGLDAPVAQWKNYWTTGPYGILDWALAAEELRKRNFQGDICLTAAYTDKEATDRLVREDIEFAKKVFV